MTFMIMIKVMTLLVSITIILLTNSIDVALSEIELLNNNLLIEGYVLT